MTGHYQIRRIGLRACVNQAEFSAPPYLVPAERTALRDGRTAHWTQRGLLRGQQSSASPTARSSSVGGPNGHLDVGPDRRLVDLELGGADRPAGAQCAEFGQCAERVSVWQRFTFTTSIPRWTRSRMAAEI